METVPGFRCIKGFEGNINGVHRWRDAAGIDHLVVHAGTQLYIAGEMDRDNAEAWTEVIGTVADSPSKVFCYNGFFYILDGVTYQRLTLDDNGGVRLTPVSALAYVPTLRLNGEEYEQRNMNTNSISFDAEGCDLEAEQIDDHIDHIGYDGRNTFSVSSKPDVSQYDRSAAKFAVLHSGEGEAITGTGENTNLLHIAILLEDEQIKWEKDALTKCPSLQSLYIMRSKEQDKGSVVFPSEGSLPVKGKVYYNFPADQFPNICGDGLELPSVGFVDNAMRFLPPNIVLYPGESVVLKDRVQVFRGADSPYYRKGVYVGQDLVDANESDLVDKIYIDSSNGFVRINVGENVAAGSYGYCGNIYGDFDETVFAVYRILVVKEGEEKKPVQDVFDYDAIPQKIEIPYDIQSVDCVKDDVGEIGYGIFYDQEMRTTALGVMAPSEKKITVFAIADPYHFSTAAGAQVTSKEAIDGCRLCAVFDNRVFLAGHPALPNTVFYSMADDPTYFGVLNYFNEGGGFERVTALLPFSDTLAVCKEDKLYYRVGADGSDNLLPRVYVGRQGALGLGCLGACCNFLDDPVFLTKEGVFGLNKADVTMERALGRRSSNVDPRLLTERELASAEMVEWEGWLCLFVNGHVYMADSRAVFTDVVGNAQYEWFYLCDIGTWRENGVKQHFYATVTGDIWVGEGPDGFSLTAGRYDAGGYQICRTDEDKLYSSDCVYAATVNGIDVFYVVDDKKAYLVYETEECESTGEFTPAKYPLCVEDRLYFAAGKELFVLNSDKRGVAVAGEEVEADEIHHSFYDFDGCRIVAGFTTRRDDCDVPHLAKSTSHRSLTVRAKLMDNGAFTMSVYTERVPTYREVVTATPHNFYAADFGNTSYHTARSAVIVGREQEKRWVEKQYLFRDGGFQRPFGIYGVAYRYRIAGRIRE